MEFVDLKTQYQEYRIEILKEIEDVMSSASFIRGPSLERFEQELKEHSGAAHAIGCSSGTDALLLGLLALGVHAGDEVLVPDFTFFATAEMVRLLGAVPVFVDIEPATYAMDPSKIEGCISRKTVGIIPVSLYGQCADMDALQDVAGAHGLWLLEDAAQSFGATYKGRRSCTLSPIAATSFFPAKPLGGYGDSGAVFCRDDETAQTIRSLLNHGQDKRYEHHLIGINGRLDSLQAAVLSVKLKHFNAEIEARQRVAERYSHSLDGEVTTPTILSHNTTVWAQYTVRVRNRDRVRDQMKSKGIPTAVHYPVPLHRQPAMADLKVEDEAYPESIRAASEVLSLPMHPFMKDQDINSVCAALKEALSE